jgi:uncharacterized protein
MANPTDGANPSLSAEVYTIPLNEGRYLIFAPLRQAAFVGNSQMVNLLADLEANSQTKAGEDSWLDFLRQLEFIGAPTETLPIAEFSEVPAPTLVTLFLTTACNLRCTYCYASANDRPIKFMRFDVAQRGIDFVLGNALEKKSSFVELAYHGGGEPTVNWEVLVKSQDYAAERARAKGLGLRTSLATNGYLSETQLDWVVTHIDGASLSFDGLPFIHDRYRISPSGQGSSQRVMQTARRFDQAGFNYGMRVTVTADEIKSLPDSIEFICRHFSPRLIQVEPAYQMGRWENAPSSETSSFIESFRLAKHRARALGRDISFSAARLGLLTDHYCQATQENFALSPDGNVSACYEAFAEDSPLADVFFYGVPDEDAEGYRFDLTKLKQLRRQSVGCREFCRACFAKWSCGGDCYYKSILQQMDLKFAGSDRCHIIRELTQDQILEKIHQSGGWFWQEKRELRSDSKPQEKGVESYAI